MRTLKAFLITLACLSQTALADCMIGELTTFAGNFVPRGYALANGQIMDVFGNDALFSILGTTYGGDGRTNFSLPDIDNGLKHRRQDPSTGNYVELELKTLICVNGVYPSRN